MEQYKNNQFIVLADVPPPIEPEALRLYKDSGINVYVLTEDYVDYAKDPDAYKAALGTLEKCGLDVFIRGLDHNVFPGYFDKFENFDFNEYSCVKGFYMIDEPCATRFDAIVENYVRLFNNKYASKFWHVNLLPSYATDEQLGVTAGKGKTAFDNYIEKYSAEVLKKVNGAKDIGFDHYPLYIRDGVYSVSEMWLSDLMSLGLAAKQNDVRFSACIQAFTGQSDGWHPPEGWRLLSSYAEILWQLYLSMAFGATIFEIFLYRDAPSFNLANGMMGVDGRPNPTYFYVKDALSEVKRIEKEFMSYKWAGVYALGESPAIAKIKSRALSGIPGAAVASQYDVVIGVFEKGTEQALLVVNYTDPVEKKVNRVDIEGFPPIYLKPGGAEFIRMTKGK